MNAFKQRCVVLRKQDYTLPEIIRITGRSKTSVYFHIQNIPLSSEKLEKIREKSSQRAKALAQERKGKSKKKFTYIKSWNENNVSLVAHFLFDGEIKSTGCVYNNRNSSLIKHVEMCMKTIYTFKPTSYINHFTGVSRISYHNVELGMYIQGKSQKLLREILTSPKNLKGIFLQSFFDDEGCMDYRPMRNMRQVRGYQKNTQILYLIQKLLCDFKISSRIAKPNEIVISGKENLKQFQKEINFSKGVRINGKRPNSIWKKPLEKRSILDQAIKSFKT